MAKTKEPPASTAKNKVPLTPPPPKKRRLLLTFFIVFMLLILAGASFVGGIYLNLIDGPALAQRLKLYDYPVIGQFFSRPTTNFETVDLGETVPETPPVAPPEAVVPATPATLGPPQADIDKEKLAKIAKQEEAKRITKLARLYNGMKPDEAVPILNQLDDDTVIAILNKMDEDQVAKIMAQFEPRRAARLTQNMLKGKTS
jgi:flagellar protein FlbB